MLGLRRFLSRQIQRPAMKPLVAVVGATGTGKSKVSREQHSLRLAKGCVFVK